MTLVWPSVSAILRRLIQCVFGFVAATSFGLGEVRAQDDDRGLVAVFYGRGFDGAASPCGELGDEIEFSEIHPELDVNWSGAPRDGFCSSR